MERGIPGLAPGRTAVMAVVNITPDSFSDGGRITSVAQAVETCGASLKAGAHILDIGGQSTRPGAVEVGPAGEMERVMPVIQAIRRQLGSEPVLSIDTFWAEVAEAALQEGANWVNDVSGGSHDPAMLPLVARWRCPYVLMHRRGDSRTMDNLAQYKDVVGGGGGCSAAPGGHGPGRWCGTLATPLGSWLGICQNHPPQSYPSPPPVPPVPPRLSAAGGAFP